MRVSITVNESRSMPGNFEIRSDSPKDRNTQYARDPGEAAAAAMKKARQHGLGGYVIFGATKVLDFIPADMRERK